MSFRPLVAALTLALILSGCSAATTDPEPELTREQRVGVQLFMHNWASVARECEDYLGPVGIDWVLVMPPSEHLNQGPWWVHYQPVSYQIESRLGTRAEFADMVARCDAAGVEVIADAVINHMSANSGGVGFAGSSFTKYDYPGLYDRSDFHDCGLTDDGQIKNYRDQAQVQTCELLGLSDLRTDSERVQQQILTYLNDLLSLGVAGFRIDAAKHIAAADLAEIIAQLPAGTRIIHEVIRGGGEPVQPEDYLASGEVWEFDYARNLKAYIASEALAHAASGIRFRFYAPSESALSFVANHDTERNSETLSWRNLQDFELGTILMLAEGYGQPMLYSGYAFERFDAAPALAGRMLADTVCQVDENGFAVPRDEYAPGQWVCQHRLESTARMIEFRHAVGAEDTREVYQRGKLFGFARGDRGYFIVNVSKYAEAQFTVQTGLPDGVYLDFLSGAKFEVRSGELTATLAPKTALAIAVTRAR
jgi:alpha-amylase